MIQDELKKYADEMIRQGHKFEDIRARLLEAGYAEEMISELKTCVVIIEEDQVKKQKNDDMHKTFGKRMPIWRLFEDPGKYFTSFKHDSGFKEPIFIFLILGLVSGLLAAISRLLMQNSQKIQVLAFANQVPTGNGLVVDIIIEIIKSCLSSLLSAFIVVGVWFLLMKMLKGKGRFVELFHSYSHLTIAMLIYMILIFFIAAILMLIAIRFSQIKIVIMVASVLLALFAVGYMLYLMTIMIRTIAEFSIVKAVLTWLIPWLVMIAIIIALIVSFNAAMFSRIRAL
ncbi:MAG: YIP1 family protein [Candidatus Woesearchaeota archaeon]|nr:YIP1 family protein [Candidatus Woesearchaeota archaeon]